MDYRALRAFEGLERLADEVFAALREHLQRHAVRNEVFVHELSQKGVLGVARRRKANLYFPEPDFQELFVQAEFFVHSHGYRERLVAVAQIDAAPYRRALDFF